MKKRIIPLLLALMLVLPLMPAAKAAGSMSGELYRLINQERAKAGLSTLNANGALNGCSAIRIGELFQTGVTHTRPDGRDWRTVLQDQKLPVDVQYSGEILCAGQSSAAEALNAFMNSQAHRDILMDSGFNFMGVGYGVKNGVGYWVVNFTRSSQLQPETDCFGPNVDEGGTGGVELPSGSVNLSVYYGDVATKDGKVLFNKENPELKCWLNAPAGAQFQSWKVIVADQQKNTLFSSEVSEEKSFSGKQELLSMFMWKEPENGVISYPTYQLECGKSYYYMFEAVLNGKTYRSAYIPFLVDGEPAAPVTLTLSGSTGSDGAVLLNSGNPGLHAALQAPIGSKITNIGLRIYSLSNTRIATVNDDRTGTTTSSPVDCSFTIWKTPVGNEVTFSNFSLTLGETYLYEFTATVNGTEYTTTKGRFRLQAPEAKTYTVTFLNPINMTYSTPKTVTNGQPYGTLPTPSSVAGYEFEGWYSDSKFTQRITKDTIVNLTGDQTLFAKMVRTQAEPVSLTLVNKTGLSGVETVSPYNGRFEAKLSAPSGCKVTQYTFNVYTTGGSLLGSVKESSNVTTDGNDYSIYRSISTSGTVSDGATLSFGDFQITAGSTYLYEFVVTVDGKTYTTERSRFRVSASSGTGFTDVKSTDYFAKAVTWAVEDGVTSGVGNGKFGPGQKCTRGQIVTFLWNATGKPEPESTANPFTDISSGDYYYKAVLWAVENDITSGLTATSFGPKSTCTRAQAMTFIWNASGKPEPQSTASPFGDVKAGEYYYKAVLWAAENGVTSGKSANSFGTGDSCTRGQIVTFLYNAKDL